MDIVNKLKKKMKERGSIDSGHGEYDRCNNSIQIIDCRICGNDFFIKDTMVSFCGHILCKDCGFEAEVRGKCLVCPSIISLAKAFKKLEVSKKKATAIIIKTNPLEKKETIENFDNLEKEREELENRKLKIIKTDIDREIFEKQFL